MVKKPYEVGYKKPPKSSQYKPGASGNPLGRPKGSSNMMTDLANALAEKIVITEHGKKREYTVQQVIMKALTHGAMKGDIRAVKEVLRLIPLVEQMLDADHEKHMESVFERASEIIERAMSEKKAGPDKT